MGLNVNDVKFLLWAKKRGVDFSKVMMIGRQRLYLDVATLQAAFSAFGINESKERLATIFSGQKGYAEPLFQFLGAAETDSIDASTYEGASNVLDMNQPIPENLHGRFSLVVDGGSLEHVFNFPTAIRNCMEMVRLNGHFITITPCNNFMGHGFYQFSPELFFRIFTAQNGFKVEKMILYETLPVTRWYEVLDPEEIGQRAEVRTRRNTLLIVQSRKIAVKPLFTVTPQQSDYAALWQGQSGTKAPRLPVAERIKQQMPPGLMNAYWNLKKWARPKIHSAGVREIPLPEAK